MVVNIDVPEQGPSVFRLEPGVPFNTTEEWLILAVPITRSRMRIRLDKVKSEPTWDPWRVLFFSSTGPMCLDSQLHFLCASYRIKTNS